MSSLSSGVKYSLICAGVSIFLLWNGFRIGPGHTETLAIMLLNLVGGVLAGLVGFFLGAWAALSRTSRSPLAFVALVANGLIAGYLLFVVGGWVGWWGPFS